MNEENYTGYHGTNNVAAQKIIEENQFIPSKDKKTKLYLGRGVYFYIEYKDAISWNIKGYKYDNEKYPNLEELNQQYDIINVDIVVLKDNILNLNKVENIKIFDELTNEIRGKLVTKPEYKYARNKNGAIINYLMKLKLLTDVDMIIRNIKDPILDSDIHSMNDIYRKVICVKNLNIIKNISMHEKVTIEDFKIVNYFYGDKVK